MHSYSYIGIVIVITYDPFYHNSGCYNINIMANNKCVSQGFLDDSTQEPYLVSVNGIDDAALSMACSWTSFCRAFSIDRLSKSSGIYSGSYVSFITSITIS